MGPGHSRLRYKVHRAVDEKAEIITATGVTAGETNEAHLLTALVDQHQTNTGKTVATAVADSKYGIIANYLDCYDRNIQAHFESFDKSNKGVGTRKGIFEPSDFIYNPMKIVLLAPPVNDLSRANLKRNAIISSIL